MLSAAEIGFRIAMATPQAVSSRSSGQIPAEFCWCIVFSKITARGNCIQVDPLIAFRCQLALLIIPHPRPCCCIDLQLPDVSLMGRLVSVQGSITILQLCCTPMLRIPCPTLVPCGSGCWPGRQQDPQNCNAPDADSGMSRQA